MKDVPATTPSPFVGRPRSLGSAKRFVTAQRDRALLRLWRSAPECVSYLSDVVKGKVEFDEGRYKSAIALLSRCLPTITGQMIQADTTAVSLNETRTQKAVAVAPTASAIEFVEERLRVLKGVLNAGDAVPQEKHDGE